MASAPLAFEHVFEPARGTGTTYTALLLHGTGADQHDLVPLGRAVAPGKALLSPLGQVRENGMPRWFRRVREGVFDEHDIRRRAEDLAGFLPHAARTYGVAPEGFVAIGFSNGANIAASLLLLHPRALRGAVLLRAMTPLVPEVLPDLRGTPVYLGAGTQDPLVPRQDVERLAELLAEAGAEVSLRWSAAGHGLAPGEVEDVRAWLQGHEDILAHARAPLGFDDGPPAP